MDEPTTALEIKNEEKKFFSLWKILLPVFIGLTVVVLMFWHESRKDNLSDVWHEIHFTWRTWLCILLGFVFMWGRDFGLTWRFRALTNRQLSWGKAYKVDFLCEFTSCVTPSAVGGSSMGMVFLNTQGIEIGRATTLMITTLFLDELFFVISCPLVVCLTPAKYIFSSDAGAFSHGIKYTFWIVYGIITLWTFLLFCGIIWKPEWISRLLEKVSKWKWLKKWSKDIATLGFNMVATSKELKKKPFIFWLEVFGGTAVSWTSRYLVVNALFLGFLPVDDRWQWVILARQFVIWVVLMVSPTPGGSGFSEWIFSNYYGDLVPSVGMALIMAIFWRIISYYVYLGIGATIIPGWLKESIELMKKNKKKRENKIAVNEAAS
ncbi:MAG: flippase-like domain-containing protein [Muribaculaceae bacterium]|nr:flippase-like domain-containing protein [Muribaculaceae bacterium]